MKEHYLIEMKNELGEVCLCGRVFLEPATARETADELAKIFPKTAFTVIELSSLHMNKMTDEILLPEDYTETKE